MWILAYRQIKNLRKPEVSNAMCSDNFLCGSKVTSGIYWDLHSKSDADWIKIKGARGDVLYTVFDDF